MSWGMSRLPPLSHSSPKTHSPTPPSQSPTQSYLCWQGQNQQQLLGAQLPSLTSFFPLSDSFSKKSHGIIKVENLQIYFPKDGQLNSSTAQWKEPEGYEGIPLCHLLAEQSWASHWTSLTSFSISVKGELRRKNLQAFDERVKQDNVYERALLPERAIEMWGAIIGKDIFDRRQPKAISACPISLTTYGLHVSYVTGTALGWREQQWTKGPVSALEEFIFPWGRQCFLSHVISAQRSWRWRWGGWAGRVTIAYSVVMEGLSSEDCLSLEGCHGKLPPFPERVWWQPTDDKRASPVGGTNLPPTSWLNIFLEV